MMALSHEKQSVFFQKEKSIHNQKNRRSDNNENATISSALLQIPHKTKFIKTMQAVSEIIRVFHI